MAQKINTKNIYIRDRDRQVFAEMDDLLKQRGESWSEFLAYVVREFIKLTESGKVR